jgi:hypothetical protein
MDELWGDAACSRRPACRLRETLDLYSSRFGIAKRSKREERCSVQRVVLANPIGSPIFEGRIGHEIQAFFTMGLGSFFYVSAQWLSPTGVGEDAPMKIGIAKERRPSEKRVAASPETVRKLAAMGIELLVEKEAGHASFFPDRF